MTERSPRELAGAAAEYIAEHSGLAGHDVALTLGSGWAGATDLLGQTVWECSAEQVPGFNASQVVGHVGTLRSVQIGETGRHALVLGARTHLYEGRGVAAVVHGVRTAAAAGCSRLVLTNGCGSVNPAWGPGTAVLIRDHLNLTATSPLVGATFVDLTEAYSPALRALAHRVAPDLPEGVYAQFPGPHFETPAEVRMAGILGADLVGMSTALETIAAREAGLEVLAISLVTNLGAGIGGQALSHTEVLDAGREAAPRLGALLAGIVTELART
ncbi:MAG: purine-nucleoside phosphorylase [Actinomycetales bacterium]